MRRLGILALLMVVACDRPEEAGKNASGLYLIREGRRYGFIDKSGKVAIAPQFDMATDFSEGLAAVASVRRWGYVDTDGKYGIKRRFDHARPFSDGMAAVQQGRRWGFVDRQGTLVVNPQFDDARGFSEGLAAVRIGDRWGFVDKSGKLAIDPQFREVSKFDGGLCAVYVSSADIWAYVDPAGKFVWGEEKPRMDDDAAQKKTVHDIRNVGTAMMSWLTDQIAAGAAGQPMFYVGDYRKMPVGRLDELLVPQYVQQVPSEDGWGRPYEYYLTTDFSPRKIMSIRSAGADGRFSADTYVAGAFNPWWVDEDIVWADGFFVRWPQATR